MNIIRSYHSEHARSHPNSEAKHCWAWVVLWWGTTRECRVLYVLLLQTEANAMRHDCPMRTASIIRSYHGENARSHPNSEAKRRWAWVVLWWGTTREFRVLYVLFCLRGTSDVPHMIGMYVDLPQTLPQVTLFASDAASRCLRDTHASDHGTVMPQTFLTYGCCLMMEHVACCTLICLRRCLTMPQVHTLPHITEQSCLRRSLTR